MCDPNQDLMKELIRDLATHYNLSERQVKFMSDSCVFDSFSKAEIESKVCLAGKTLITDNLVIFSGGRNAGDPWTQR